MQPINPDDLILRPAASSDEEKQPAGPVVPLERFQELERTLREIPLTVEPYIELAEIYRKAHRWSDVRRVLEKAVQRFPDDSHVRDMFEQAQLSRSQELYAIADSEYKAEPTQLTLENLQRSQLELNGLRERIFRDRLSRHPDQLELLLPLAESLDQLDRRDEAIELLKKACQKPELRAEASLQLGKLLEHSHRVPEALSAYRQAALYRLPPPSPAIQIESLQRAADLAERTHLFDSARRYVAMLVELQPNQPSLTDRLHQLSQKGL